MVDQAAREGPPAEPGRSARVERHRVVQGELERTGDEELLRRLCDARLADQGPAAIHLPESNAQVFVKLLPLTALELEPQSRHATANLFKLPLHYQYRLGSLGFGAWRELEVCRTTNRWVLSGQCPHFPLLHHWRILPIVGPAPDEKASRKTWGDDKAIRRRVSAVTRATSSVALFLEHFPTTLAQWLRGRSDDGVERTSVVRQVEGALLDVVTFVNDHGLLHMDVHLENVLTDGDRLFLTDHGLAISRTFSLDGSEREFFDTHQDFDRCTAVTSLVHAVVAHYDSQEDGDSRNDWRQAMGEMVDGSHSRSEDVADHVRSYLKERRRLVLATSDFYHRLTNDFATRFPAPAPR